MNLPMKKRVYQYIHELYPFQRNIEVDFNSLGNPEIEGITL